MLQRPMEIVAFSLLWIKMIEKYNEQKRFKLHEVSCKTCVKARDQSGTTESHPAGLSSRAALLIRSIIPERII